MVQILPAILFLLSLIWIFGLGAFFIVSLNEGEKRAALLSGMMALVGGAFFVITINLPAWFGVGILVIILAISVLAVLLFLLPIGRVPSDQDTPQVRFDERDIMFARADLQPGSPEYQAYYAMRPENEAVDARTRAKPGLMSPRAKLANPLLFASPRGSFFLTEALREAVVGPVADERVDLPPDQMTQFLKDLTIFFGAERVGAVELQPYHVYSYAGRDPGAYGEPIGLDHRYALAFTVEMDHRMVASSPNPQTLMETAKKYVDAASVAVQLAATIRMLGYPARAHIDGNYRVIAPLVARDAGLGEIGRMGLLMTPNLGPRVRLGVVTTDVELVPDERTPDPTVIDFCNICKKCADNCPSQSISFEERQEIDGAVRWRIKSETCYQYWNVIGTDCNRCMAVCPYSHPDNPTHNLVRWGIARSGGFRRGALWLDDLFYGKYPTVKAAPAWTRITDKEVSDI